MPRPPLPDEPILAAAAELFAEHGFRGTTTIAIAKHAGVNEVTLFRKFGSKRGILQALTNTWRTKMAGMIVDTVIVPGDVCATVRALVRVEIEGAIENGLVVMRLMAETAVPEVAETMAGNPYENLEGLAHYLEARAKEGLVRADISPWIMSEVFFAMTSTQAIVHRMMGLENPSGATLDSIVNDITELYCSAIQAKPVA